MVSIQSWTSRHGYSGCLMCLLPHVDTWLFLSKLSNHRQLTRTLFCKSKINVSMCFKNKLSRVVQIVSLPVEWLWYRASISFLCLGEDITEDPEGMVVVSTAPVTTFSRTLVYISFKFTSVLTLLASFWHFHLCLDNCVFQFSFKSISIANIFQLKKI